MLGEAVDVTIRKIPALSQNGLKIARAIHQAILDGGKGPRSAADFLHGIWLGHPLHPMLTDVAIGAWVFSAYFDLLSLLTGSRKSRDTADSLLGLGNLAALPTAAAGITDFSAVSKGAAGPAFTHGILNIVAYTFFLSSQLARSAGLRIVGVILSLIGATFMFAGAYLGGHLTFKHKVGVNHASTPREPQEWTAILPAADLRHGAPTRVEHNGQAILLYRRNANSPLFATGAVCPHAGGPLEEGHFDGDCVQCPWHDSVFNLHDGRVVHGPSTYPVPNYDARIAGGQVEIRLARA